MMTIVKYSLEEGVFATSAYGDQWAGPDGDRLTIALLLLQSETPSSIQIESFVESLEYEPSAPVSSIIESTTDWKVLPDGEFQLITSSSSLIVGISKKNNISQWPDFSSEKSFDEEQRKAINEAWKKEVSGVSQGAYVSQSQHMLSMPSRLGLHAQEDDSIILWPPRQLNNEGERIPPVSSKLDNNALILTWTKLSALGAPSEFSLRAPLLGGVSTVLVEFTSGPKGVFMLADDEDGEPSIDQTVSFEVRRLYGQDNLIHYGLKALLN
tara:strand:+ start:970 stop:1773 length:804 start_codon:yes stop_codon:yes gene_type:complete